MKKNHKDFQGLDTERILTEEWGFQGLIELNTYLLSIACYNTRGNNHATKIG
jgi:hypothetical protein